MPQIGIKKKQGSVVEILKEAILSGNISGGMEITQKELAESLGVSRMPVREALILLEYQGLIERFPNNHVRVTEFTRDHFKEIFSLCAELEHKVLEAGFVLNEQEKHSRFLEGSWEEMMIHYQISQKVSNIFLRKTLDTILEIYVDFAVRCKDYDRERGMLLLKSALDASAEQRKGSLEKYFCELERVILHERRGKC